MLHKKKEIKNTERIAKSVGEILCKESIHLKMKTIKGKNKEG
jgi:hypothetical protein